METQELINTLYIAAEDNKSDLPLYILIRMAAERLEDLSDE